MTTVVGITRYYRFVSCRLGIYITSLSMRYDTRRLMCCLVTTWCSQSSCKQRRGRAGRTMPGRAVCLVPRRFFERQLPLFDPPEMLNAPLTKLYLQAKQLCSTLHDVADRLQLPASVRMDVSAPKALLQEVVQPPSLELLDAAIWELAQVGCLTSAHEEAEITPLGQIAIALPCDLRICRLLFLGCLFRCPADALAMAAGLTAPDPFSAPSLLVLKDFNHAYDMHITYLRTLMIFTSISC